MDTSKMAIPAPVLQPIRWLHSTSALHPFHQHARFRVRRHNSNDVQSVPENHRLYRHDFDEIDDFNVTIQTLLIRPSRRLLRISNCSCTVGQSAMVAPIHADDKLQHLSSYLSSPPVHLCTQAVRIASFQCSQSHLLRHSQSSSSTVKVTSTSLAAMLRVSILLSVHSFKALPFSV